MEVTIPADLPATAQADDYVFIDGYVRYDGVRVAPHWRRKPKR